MRSHWKQLRWAWKLGEAGAQGIIRAAQIAWARWSVRYGACLLAKRKEWVIRGTHCYPLLAFLLRESCLSRSSSDAGKFIFSLLTLVPFKLLSQSLSSKGESLNKSGHGPFTKNCPCFSSPLFPSIPLAFTARSYGDFSFWNWNNRLGGGTDVGRKSLTPLGNLCSWNCLPVSVHHRWGWDEPILYLNRSWESQFSF